MGKEESMKQGLRSALAVLAVVLVFGAGFFAGQFAPSVSAGTLLQAESSDHVARFEQIWDLVHAEFVTQPVDDEALLTGAINGMLEVLDDQHTSYMPPGEFELLNATMDGSYTGIGAEVEAKDDRLYIVSPFEGSPAEAAGLEPGDEIVQVDDTPIAEFEDPLAAITLVRGPEGEPVTLKIRREGRLFDVTVVRGNIPLISAEGEMLDNGIGYVQVSDFGATTTEQLREALEAILAEEPQGLILDLRGNPGGSLQTAIEVTSEFIGEGTVMVEEWGNGTKYTYEAETGGLATDTDLPLIVLVDAGSASASEIVAGAIQDVGRGQLLGETTYGKGTVQNWHDLGEGNGGVRITIAKWLTPKERWIHEEGLTPDVEVVPSASDHAEERDIQLESAVNLLLGLPAPVSSENPLYGGGASQGGLPVAQ
jgi:carboxyl-terminal processing protease